MKVYLNMPYGYQIAHSDAEEIYPYSLLKNGNFLFSGETEKDCFDAMATCHASFINNNFPQYAR